MWADQKIPPPKAGRKGIAAGATTAVILQCIALLGYDAQVISLDLSDEYYRDKSRKTGYLLEKLNGQICRKVDHTVLTGKYAVEYLDFIGGEIDFLFLDTVHSMPGEFLDFLGFFPSLRTGSVVALHDIALNHCSANPDAIATQLVLDVVTADKIMNMRKEHFSNIGAFRVTQETESYIFRIDHNMEVSARYG